MDLGSKQHISEKITQFNRTQYQKGLFSPESAQLKSIFLSEGVCSLYPLRLR